MPPLESQALKLSAKVRHSEDWSTEYKKDPKTHAKLIVTESRLRIDLTKFFATMASQIAHSVNWQAYVMQVPRQHLAQDQTPDFNVDVIVQNVPVEQYDGTFIKVVFETLATMTGVGATAGETIYGVPLGIQSTDTIIQQLTTEHVASLVGKKVNPDGSIVDNPNAEYTIDTKTRNDIAQSIKTSLNLGETVQDATDRLTKTIANPARAKIIAQTESVNAYQSGLMEFGKQSGAVGKEWQDVGAVDVCATNTADGMIPFDAEFSGGVTQPTQHVNCRCGLRLVYQKEWDDTNGGANPYPVTTGITPKT